MSSTRDHTTHERTIHRLGPSTNGRMNSTQARDHR